MSQSYKDIIQEQLPYKVYKSNDVESMALGKVLNKLQESTDKLELNVNPQTTLKEGLKLWEDFFNLVINENESMEFRRARVLSELIQYMGDENVITKEEMESILALYGGNPNVIEYPLEYFFLINYNNINLVDIRQLNSIITKIKPSYLGCLFASIKLEEIAVEEEYFLGKALYPLCGRANTKSKNVSSNISNININEMFFARKIRYRICGRYKTKSVESGLGNKKISISENYTRVNIRYHLSGKAICGGGTI